MDDIVRLSKYEEDVVTAVTDKLVVEGYSDYELEEAEE